MKNIILFLLPFLLLSCDPRFDASYYIDNQTDSNVTIFFQSVLGTIDTSIISKDTKLLIFTEGALGQTSKKHLDNLKNLPFDSLRILNNQMKEYNKRTSDIENWEKVYPSKEENFGKVILVVRPGDFD